MIKAVFIAKTQGRGKGNMGEDNTAESIAEEIELTPLGKPPKFFSLAFHKDFFPVVLRQAYLRRKKQSLGYTAVSWGSL